MAGWLAVWLSVWLASWRWLAGCVPAPELTVVMLTDMVCAVGVRFSTEWPEDIVAVEQPSTYEAESAMPGLVAQISQLGFIAHLPKHDDAALRYSLAVGHGSDWCVLCTHMPHTVRVPVGLELTRRVMFACVQRFAWFHDAGNVLCVERTDDPMRLG